MTTRSFGSVVMAWCLVACGARAQLVIDRADYADRLRAMWLGECIANWTGLRTEGHFPAAPFLSDPDWGQIRAGQLVDFELLQDPWKADDDTDVEYIYLHQMSTLGVNRLSEAQIGQGWVDHINRYIWVSNARARELLGRGVTPRMSGQLSANSSGLMIDAQLTTEFFGLLCPGMPERALQMAELPMRTTSCGYATHAAQFYAVLYALAPRVDRTAAPEAQVLWLFDQARRFLPDSSKSAKIADLVRADYLANPDVNDWERTRDLIADRFQVHAGQNGWVFRAWYESSVNFASGCTALLYGRGDFKRTIQIATMYGWDSDNATATLGGLLGFMLGYDGLRSQFLVNGVPRTFSDRFDIYRTRDNLPSYLTGDASAQDTFTLMSQRMLPIIDREVAAAGGVVGTTAWTLPASPLPSSGSLVAYNPVNGPSSDDARSVNVWLKRHGGSVSARCSAFQGSGGPTPPGGSGATANVQVVCNGLEHDFSGREVADWETPFFSTEGTFDVRKPVWIEARYSTPMTIQTIRFIEGDHKATGGWFSTLGVQVLVNGRWAVPTLASTPHGDPAVPFEILDFELAQPMTVTGVRAMGVAGGTGHFVTCAELDALAPVAGARAADTR